jgi:hypothetical protein
VVAGDEVEREDIGRDGVLRERRGAALAAAAPPGERAGEAGADEDDEDDADAEAEQRQHRARRRAVRHHRCLCLGFSEKEEPAASRAEPRSTVYGGKRRAAVPTRTRTRLAESYLRCASIFCGAVASGRERALGLRGYGVA